MQCIYEGKPSPTVIASAALGECNTGRRVARRNNARVLQAVDRELVLAPFNAHGAKRPALLKSWLTMLGLFVPASWA